MNLNKSQKKFLKKNLRRLPLDEISRQLGIKNQEILDYLKSIWPEEKFQKFINSNNKTLTQEKNLPSSEPITNPKEWLKKNLVALTFLSLIILTVFSNSLSNEFLSDDIAGIMQDKNMGNVFFYLRNQPINFFRYFFYSIVFKIFGLNPFFFRLLNILFHIGSTWTIYALAALLYNQDLALIAASIFAVHPIVIEGVVWITGGIHAQYSFFVLLSFLLFLLSKFHNWSKKTYLLSVISFIWAIFTTEKSAILPLILLVYELSLRQITKNWKKLIPYFMLSGVAALLVFFGGSFGKRVFLLHSQYYQEQGLYNPLTQIPIAISSYLSLTFWPDKLTLYHSEMSFSPRQYFFMIIITLCFFGLIIWTLIQKRYRKYFFWLAFLIISLMPMLTPFKVAWIVAERYFYLGSVGIFILVAFGIEKIGEIVKNKKVSFVITGLLIIILSVRTVIRNIDWKNQDNLWLAAERTSPSSPQNHNNLGDLYSRRGQYEKAAEEFKKAIMLLPNYGDAYHNLGNTYRLMSKNDLAAESYQKAISFNPLLWQSYQNLSVIYFENQHFQKASETIEQAIAINPKNPELHTISGIVHLQLNNKQKAKEEFLKTIEIDPNNQKAQEFLSKLKTN